MRIGNLVFGTTDMVFLCSRGGPPKIVYRRGNECGQWADTNISWAAIVDDTRPGSQSPHLRLPLPNLGLRRRAVLTAKPQP